MRTAARRIFSGGRRFLCSASYAAGGRLHYFALPADCADLKQDIRRSAQRIFRKAVVFLARRSVEAGQRVCYHEGSNAEFDEAALRERKWGTRLHMESLLTVCEGTGARLTLRHIRHGGACWRSMAEKCVVSAENYGRRRWVRFPMKLYTGGI